VMNRPGGKIVAVLNDNVEVDVMSPYLSNGKWFPIGFVAYLNKTGLIKNPRREVKENFLLYDKQGRLIGRTIGPLRFDWEMQEELGRVAVVINIAYVSQSNIRPNSIPEYQLQGILDKHERQISKHDLEQFLMKYKFKIWPIENDRELIDYMILESELNGSGNPLPRTHLIFYKSHLVAVIHNDLLDSKNYISQPLHRKQKIMYVGKVNGDVVDRIQKEILNPLRY